MFLAKIDYCSPLYMHLELNYYHFCPKIGPKNKSIFYTYRRVPPFGLYVEKILDIKFFGNFKKKSPKGPSQDLSNIERNKVMKNQPIWGIPQGLAYDNQSGGVCLFDPPPMQNRVKVPSFLSGWDYMSIQSCFVINPF